MNVLFVGLGSIGKRHLQDFCRYASNEDIHITALRNTERTLDEATERLIERQINTLDSVHYDIAFITNPTNLHYETIMNISEKADYYFIEKPIFMNLDEKPDELPIDENNAYIACPMRHSKVYKELKKIVDNNKVFSARIICSSYLPDWRPQIDYRKNYSAIKEMGGGVELDLVHEIDYMVGLFGFPRTVKSIVGKYSDLEITSNDLAVYIADYEDKVCEVHLDYFGREYNRKCELYTPSGTYVADFGKEEISCPDGSLIDCRAEKDDDFHSEMKYFLNFVKGEAEAINTPGHAYEVLKISKGIER